MRNRSFWRAAIVLAISIAAVLLHAVPALTWQGVGKPLEPTVADESDSPAAAESANNASSADSVQTASFQGVVPGETTLEDVKKALGEPLSAAGDNG